MRSSMCELPITLLLSLPVAAAVCSAALPKMMGGFAMLLSPMRVCTGIPQPAKSRPECYRLTDPTRSHTSGHHHVVKPAETQAAFSEICSGSGQACLAGAGALERYASARPSTMGRHSACAKLSDQHSPATSAFLNGKLAILMLAVSASTATVGLNACYWTDRRFLSVQALSIVDDGHAPATWQSTCSGLCVSLVALLVGP